MNRRQAELAADVAPALVPLAQVCAKYALEERALKKRTEAKKELVEARHATASPVEHAEPEEPDQTATQQQEDAVEPTGASQTHQDLTPELHDLAEDETCSTCAAALRAMEKLEPAHQEIGLEEYHQLKERMDGGVDGSQEIKDFLDDTEVLGEAMQAAVA